tara:strand:- start:200 stop:490 length:291 start_codon:yes stop_codon:yes gene_type:complete
MDLLETITIKNKLEILILSIDKKALKGSKQQNYETLLEVLKTMNNAMLHFENLGDKLKEQKNINTTELINNAKLKIEVSKLTKQVDELKDELKKEF